MFDLKKHMAGAGESGQRPATGRDDVCHEANDNPNPIEGTLRKTKRIRVLAIGPNGKTFETIKETHNSLGDWHGRYVLRCTVQILEQST